MFRAGAALLFPFAARVASPSADCGGAGAKRVPQGRVPLLPRGAATARGRGASPQHELSTTSTPVTWWGVGPFAGRPENTRGHGCSELVFSSCTRLSCRRHGSAPRASSRRPATRPRRRGGGKARCVLAYSCWHRHAGAPDKDVNKIQPAFSRLARRVTLTGSAFSLNDATATAYRPV